MKKTKVIYLMGMGRSGGTLLGRLLGQHENAVYVGELRYFLQRGVLDNSPCGCGELFSECKVWSRVYLQWKQSVEKLGLDAELPKLEGLNRTSKFPIIYLNKLTGMRNSIIEQFGACEAPLYESVSEICNAETIVESSRYPGRALLLSMMPNLEVYVVHLIRDPRGTICSQLKQAEKRGLPKKTYPLKRVLHWLAINLLSSLSGFAIAKKQFLYMRYEDFVSEPEHSINRILDFAGEPDTSRPRFHEREVALSQVHVFSGNENRVSTGPISIEPDTSWIEKLPKQTKRFILWITYLPLKIYGY